MKNLRLLPVLCCGAILTMVSCIDNNNKDAGNGQQQESDYETEAPTYNKTRDDMNAADTTSTGTSGANTGTEAQGTRTSDN